MDLKPIVARIRKTLNRETTQDYIDLPTFTAMCNRVGLSFKVRYWRDKCRDGVWPSIQVKRQYHVRRDYADEFLKILAAEAS